MILVTKKCRIYVACGVSQTPMISYWKKESTTMALTARQTEAVISLFANSFIYSKDETEKKKLLIDFEDDFGKSIPNWKELCRDRISDENNLASFDSLLDRKNKDYSEEYQIRLLQEKDLPQVREMVNKAFDLILTQFDDDRLKKFVESGYSVVATSGEEVGGVIFAFDMPSCNLNTIYIDTFCVAENIRGLGIGKKMLRQVMKIGHNGGYAKIILQTDRNIDAYQIYKHLGFQEDELTHMHLYFV